MTNICAAIGLAQLESAKQIIDKKRVIAETYRANLEGTPLKVLWQDADTVNSFWMVTVGLEDSSLRDSLREFLDKNQIETRPTFYPVHTMPMYFKKLEKHPVAEQLGWAGMNLPSYPALTTADIQFICAKVKEFYAGLKK